VIVEPSTYKIVDVLPRSPTRCIGNRYGCASIATSSVTNRTYIIEPGERRIIEEIDD
jgi:hypothetical protein